MLELKQMFLEFDTNNDGFLSRDEIRTGIRSVYGTINYKSPESEDIINKLDLNHDGKVSYVEFITTMANRTRLLTDQNLEVAFNVIDKNGDGRLSKAELKDAFHSGHAEEDQLWDDIMAQFDLDGDEYLDKEEFFKAMKLRLFDEEEERKESQRDAKDGKLS